MTIAIHVDQTREESMLGASEAPGVLGLDKYNPPIKIWRRHRGLQVHDDAEQSEPAYWGNVLEPVVRGHYAVTSRRMVLVPSASTTLGGWLRTTLDGVSYPASPRLGPMAIELPGAYHEPDIITRGVAVDVFVDWVPEPREVADRGGLQVKTCSAYLLDDWRDGIPPKYEVQCRTEMAVTAMPWTDLVCLCGGQRYLGPFRIFRDLAIEERIMTSLAEFWSMVRDGREPRVDDTESWRLHVSEKMDRAPRVTAPMTDAIESVVRDWRDRRRVRIQAERDEETRKNEMLLQLSAAGATRVAGADGAVTAYRTKSGTWALRTPSAWKEDA